LGEIQTADREYQAGDGDSVKHKPDIVCLSTQDWDDLWTRKQRFMKRFAEMGCRVLYVETQVHMVTYIRERFRRWRRALRFLRGAREVEPNLWVLTPPPMLPFYQMSETICLINSIILSWFINRQIWQLGLNDIVAYSYAPYTHHLMKRLPSEKRIYECVDEYCVDKGLVRREIVERQEEETIRGSDAVIVTAPFLKERKKKYGNVPHLIPNGVQVDHYESINRGEVTPADEMRRFPGPVVGFLGALAYWIDLELLEYLARELPDHSFVFIGPVFVDTRRFNHMRNVHFIGRKPYNELPSYMAGVDVCINPYILDDIASGCSPLKIYEYLACGKPIVSVRMPEAEKFDGLVSIADNYSEFAEMVRVAALMPSGPRRELASRSWKEALNHSWDNRFAETLRVMEECLDENRD